MLGTLEDSLEALSLDCEEMISLDSLGCEEMISLDSLETLSLACEEGASEERSEDCSAGEEASEEGATCEAEEGSAEDWGCAEEAGPLLFDDESALKMEHDAKRAPTDKSNKALIGFFIQKFSLRIFYYVSAYIHAKENPED